MQPIIWHDETKGIDMTHKLYNLNNEFIGKCKCEGMLLLHNNFTGIIVSRNKDKFWYLNGVFHRLDGPAYVSFN